MGQRPQPLNAARVSNRPFLRTLPRQARRLARNIAGHRRQRGGFGVLLGEVSDRRTDLDVDVGLVTFDPRARNPPIGEHIDLPNEGLELRQDPQKQEQPSDQLDPGTTSAAPHRPPQAARPSLDRRWEGAPITTAVELATLWPHLRRSLLVLLRKRRVDQATAEDICQDVAERVLRSTEAFATPDNLSRWATRVALNQATDLGRMRQRHIASGELPDPASPFDIEAAVTHRLALDETAAAMASLRPEERRALVAILRPESPPLDRPTQNRENIRRLRARARLRGLVRNFPAVFPARWWGWLRRRAPVIPDLGPLAAAGLSIALALGPSSSPSATSPPHLPVTRTSPAAPATAPSDAPSAARSGIPTVADRQDVRASTGGDLPDVPPSRSTLVAVSDPASETRVGFADNGPEKPLICVVTQTPASACVPNPAPQLPPLSS